jgi:Asp-tRNA(Asn)/Glu-tRNA(Gln) amidotransferase A subunit family amidase
MVHLKDRICHMAYIAWTDRIAPKDALLIQLLKKAGAIFHVRTNEPQTVMVGFFFPADTRRGI